MFGETSAGMKDPTPQQVLNDLHLYSTECNNVYIYRAWYDVRACDFERETNIFAVLCKLLYSIAEGHIFNCILM